MQCRCQFAQEKVCVSREQYAQVRKLVLGRLDNASPCLCVFSKNVCHEQYARVSLVARHLQWTDAPPTPRRTDTDTHTHRQPHNHTPNHTDTPYHTPTYPNPPGGTRRAHELEAKGFFRLSYTEGFFSSGNKVFFFRGGSRCVSMQVYAWMGSTLSNFVI